MNWSLVTLSWIKTSKNKNWAFKTFQAVPETEVHQKQIGGFSRAPAWPFLQEYQSYHVFTAKAERRLSLPVKLPFSFVISLLPPLLCHRKGSHLPPSAVSFLRCSHQNLSKDEVSGNSFLTTIFINSLRILFNVFWTFLGTIRQIRTIKTELFSR